MIPELPKHLVVQGFQVEGLGDGVAQFVELLICQTRVPLNGEEVADEIEGEAESGGRGIASLSEIMVLELVKQAGVMLAGSGNRIPKGSSGVTGAPMVISQGLRQDIDFESEQEADIKIHISDGSEAFVKRADSFAC